jgi:hypothetical protein
MNLSCEGGLLQEEPARHAGSDNWNYITVYTPVAAYKGGRNMIKVKTFMSPLKIFHTVEELSSLDNQINRFITEEGVKRIVSVSDACTTDDTGATIGVIRVIAYEV